MKAKPYDPKKSCWVPDKASGGYLEGLIESTDGDKVTVKINETGDVSIKYVLTVILNLDSVSLMFEYSMAKP